MAVEFGVGVGDHLRIASGLPGGSSYSAAFWFRPAAVPGSGGVWHALLSWGDASNERLFIGYRDGRLLLWLGTAAITSALTLTAGMWRHVVYVRDGTSHMVYVDGTAEITRTETPYSPGAGAELRISSNLSGGVSGCNSRVAGLKWFNVALSQDEARAEGATFRPRRGASMYDWWPLLSAADVAARGGGHDWTVGGTVGTADGPPAVWGGEPLIIVAQPAPAPPVDTAGNVALGEAAPTSVALAESAAHTCEVVDGVVGA
jgi:hypothetical protein